MKFSRKVRQPLYEINHYLGIPLVAAGIMALKSDDPHAVAINIVVSVYWLVVVMLAKKVRPPFATLWMCPDCYEFNIVWMGPDENSENWFPKFLGQHKKLSPDCTIPSTTLFLCDSTDHGPFGQHLSAMHIDVDGECKIEPMEDYMLKQFMRKGLENAIAGE